MWRRANRLSQRQLAVVLGLCRKTIQNVEAGRHKPVHQTQQLFEELKERYRVNGERKGTAPAAWGL